MIIGEKTFEIGKRPYIMGILNVTPDSFSDGGRYNRVEDALKQTQKMVEDGADLIDVGGESTRPGYIRITEEEELARVIPVIEAIKKRFDIPVSLDTYKAGVAEAGILAGADMINDIWGLKGDPAMAEVLAKHQTACCLMHNRFQPDYTDVLNDVISDLNESVKLAVSSGMKKDRLLVDPGIGFAKTYEQNLILLHHLEGLRQLGLPILLGTSRKSVIGLTLSLPPDEREEGTIATSVIGFMKGCSFFRVHDVAGNYRALKMAEAIFES